MHNELDDEFEKQRLIHQEEIKKEKERSLLLAPDKEKLNNLAIEITAIKMPKVKDQKAKKVIIQTIELLNSLSNYIKANAIKL